MEEPPKGVTILKKNYNINMIPCQNFGKMKVKILFASMGENEVQFF